MARRKQPETEEAEILVITGGTDDKPSFEGNPSVRTTIMIGGKPRESLIAPMSSESFTVTSVVSAPTTPVRRVIVTIEVPLSLLPSLQVFEAEAAILAEAAKQGGLGIVDYRSVNTCGHVDIYMHGSDSEAMTGLAKKTLSFAGSAKFIVTG